MRCDGAAPSGLGVLSEGFPGRCPMALYFRPFGAPWLRRVDGMVATQLDLTVSEGQVRSLFAGDSVAGVIACKQAPTFGK